MAEFNEFDTSVKQPQRDFGDILSHAFENYRGIIGYAIVLTVLLIVVSCLLALITGGWSEIMEMIRTAGPGYNSEIYKEMYSSGPIMWWMGGSFLFFILASPLIVGIIYLMHKKNSGQTLDFSDLFIGFQQNTVNIMLFSLIVTIITGICNNYLYYIPTIFIMPFFFLGYPILFFENKGAIDAIKKSFEIAKNNYGAFILLNLVAYLISVLGIVACCIGIIATAAFYYATMYSAYVAYNGVPRQLTHTT